MPQLQVGSLQARRTSTKSCKKHAVKTSASIELSNITGCKNNEKDLSESRDTKHRSNSSLKESLQHDKNTRLGRMINEMYAADFEEDFQMLLLLLKKLRVEDENIAEYKDKLLQAEMESMEDTFAQLFEVLTKKKREPSSSNHLGEKHALDDGCKRLI